MDNLRFSCFVIGTSLSIRVENLIMTLKSIDEKNFNFEKKILSIDDFGNGVSKEVTDYCELNSWLVLNEPAKGMVQNQIKALNNIDTEWVLYCEDDVIIEKLPTINQITELININNKVGMISMTGGGYNTHINHDKILENIKNDIIQIGDDEIFWFRDPSLSNEWFFEFPSTFVKTDIFKNCITTSLTKFTSIQIEESYTKSYFHLGYNTEYDKYTWSRDFVNYLDYSDSVTTLLGFICTDLIYLKHNRNNYSQSVGGGYFV